MADESFTRSLYIGRDKMAEVTKRREAVEAELKARREAKIRLQNERLNRAAQQKEAELKNRTRERHEKELMRQKAVLDRRYAQLEKEKVKKAEILQKAHISASRTAQTTKKPIYVFGSSTPRELTYLEKLSAEQKNGSVLTSTSSTRGQSTTPPVRTPSRIVPGVMGPPPSTAMTRSVFGRLNNERKSRVVRPPPTKNKHPPPPPPTTRVLRGSTPLLKKSSATNSDSSVLAATAMTQSLYVSKPKPHLTPKKITPRNFSNNTTSNNNLPHVQLPLKSAADAKIEIENKPPGIRPRKALLQQPIKSEIGEPVGTNIDEEIIPKVELSEVLLTTLNEKQKEAEISKKNEKQGEEQNNGIFELEKENDSKSEIGVLKDFQHGIGENSLFMENNSIKDLPKCEEKFTTEKAIIDDIFQNLNVEPQQEMVRNSVEYSNNGFIITDTYPIKSSTSDSDNKLNGILQNNDILVERKNDDFLVCIENDHETSNGNEIVPSTPVISEVPLANTLEEVPDSVKTSVKPVLLFASEASKQAEQERENRRQRLNEILQRTRQDQNGYSTEPKLPLVASNPSLLEGINASALAQDLLAQRRLQKLQQQQQLLEQQKKPPSLASEFNGLGYFGGENATILPGQVIPGKGDFMRKTLEESKSQDKPPEDPHNNNYEDGTKTTNGRSSFSPESSVAI